MSHLDGPLLMATRGLRMFAYGALSVALALYLAARGLSAFDIGLLFSVALAGGAVTSAVVAAYADRWGRRRTLIANSLLLMASGAVLAQGRSLVLLLAAALLGTLSPSGGEVGPFQSLEQAALASVTPPHLQVRAYAWWTFVGSLAGAFGALAGGLLPTALAAAGWSRLASLQALVWFFAATGVLLALLSLPLSRRMEAPLGAARPGLHTSSRVVWRLSGLFSIDFLASGFIVQGLVAYWFQQRYGTSIASLGALFFGTNLLSAASAFVSARLAGRFGLLRTMVFTHLPSNLLLIGVPFMPTWQLAALLLLLRNCAAQMDVPARQAYLMALVPPGEQAAAAGVTNAAKNAANSVAPLLTGIALQGAASGLPFMIAGVLKVTYDLCLWFTFRRVPLPPAEPRG